MQNMDGVDSDMVLEVPDTPDRFTVRRPSGCSSKPSWEEDDVGGGINPSLFQLSPEPASKTYVRRCREFSDRNATDNSGTSCDIDFFFTQGDLARRVPESVEPKPSSTSQTKPHGFEQKRVENESGKKRETIDLSCSPFPLSHPTRCRDSRRKSVRVLEGRESGRPSIGMEEEAYKLNGDNVGLKTRDKGKGVDICNNAEPRNGYIIPCSTAPKVCSQNVRSSVDQGTCSSDGTSNRDGTKGIDLCRDLQLRGGQPSRPRSTGKRRLVRNGCISPYNIERGKNVVRRKEGELQENGIMSHQIHIISPDSEGSHADKRKGKAIVDNIVIDDRKQGRDNPPPNRVCSLPEKDVPVNANTDCSTDRLENKGWRTTRNHIRKPSKLPSSVTASISKSGDVLSDIPIYSQAIKNRSSVDVVHDDPEVTSLPHGSNLIPVEDLHESDSESRSTKGKRKFSSTHSRAGECSSSTSSNLEISYPPRSRRLSNSRPARSRRSQRNGIMLGPIIEVDELQSPEVSCSNPSEQNRGFSDHSIARDIQVESDEVLARQLQEEFYNEAPANGAGGTEIDAAIAWSLLQENDGPRASLVRQSPSRRRDSSNLSARVRYRQSPGRPANRGRHSASSRIAQLRRNFYTPMMDVEMRLNFLEALEAAFGDDQTRANHVLQAQRDFNENDYEMLLALDENNHQHVGASENQINNLPQSVIQNDSEETCAVCLEAPSSGDTIRHLPCLHKFHKECIDTWLRRRMSCPICKCGIT